MSELHNPVSAAVYLSEELVLDILKRLPVKTLLRCISVCKSWRSLIKSREFISTHFDHHLTLLNNNVGLTYLLYQIEGQNRFVVHSDDDRFFKKADFVLPYIAILSTVGCCNGIVCLSLDDDLLELALLNPCLRKFLPIDVPGYFIASRCFDRLGFGFGFESSSTDYKIVAFRYPRNAVSPDTRPGRVYVFSLNGRSWRRVNASFVLPGRCFIGTGVHLNGIVYWLVKRANGSIGFLGFSILMFNLREESFGRIPLSEELGVGYTIDDAVLLTVPRIGSKRENLAFVCTENDGAVFSHWVREESGGMESWKKVVSINKEVMVKTFGDFTYVKPLYFRRDGEIVVSLDGHRFIAFDTKDIRSFRLLGNQELYRNYGYCGTYMENLALLT